MPRYLPSLFLALFILFQLPAYSSADVELVGPPDLPVLGVDALVRGALVEDHSEALPRWALKGFRRMTVLHVDSYDGLGPLGPKVGMEFSELAGRGVFSERGQESLLSASRSIDEWNLLTAGHDVGMVGRVVWITPWPIHLLEGSVEKLAAVLVKSGFSSGEAAALRFTDGCYEGTRGGVPLMICGQEKLPTIDEPVLLSMDLNYFQAASYARKVAALDLAYSFLKSAEDKRYQLADVLFSYSIRSGEVQAMSRWLGDATMDIMRHPAVRNSPRRPPEFTILQQADLQAAQDAYEAMYDSLMGYLKHYPGRQPPLLLSKALAGLMVGNTEQALAEASESCKADMGYCYGLMELGLRLLEAGDKVSAERFFGAAQKISPGITYNDLGMGVAWLRAGEFDKALAAYNRLAVRYPDLPYGFAIGQLYLVKGEKDKAREYFQAALNQAEVSPQDYSVNQLLAVGARAAYEYFRESGMEESAQRLERTKWLSRE